MSCHSGLLDLYLFKYIASSKKDIVRARGILPHYDMSLIAMYAMGGMSSFNLVGLWLIMNYLGTYLLSQYQFVLVFQGVTKTL